MLGLSGIGLGCIINQISHRITRVVSVILFLLMSTLSTIILMLTIQSTIFIKTVLYVLIWVLPFIYTHIRTNTVSDKGIWGLPLSYVMIIIIGQVIQIEILPYRHAFLVSILMASLGLKGLEFREIKTWWIASVIIQLIWMGQHLFINSVSLLMWLLIGSLIL